MDKNRLFVDFHVIQSVPPSCINRDDTGTPKTASYGGVMRARVSSQAWKHAMRKYFRSAEKAESEEHGMSGGRLPMKFNNSGPSGIMRLVRI